MIDDRFTSAAFEARGLDTIEARRLADELAREIQDQIDIVVLAVVERIVHHLNSMGHSLTPEYPPKPGDISFRDDTEHGPAYECKLRIGVDTVISTGYSHLLSDSELDDLV